MFSWSSSSNNSSKQQQSQQQQAQRRPSTSAYPAQRVAQAVQGSIRPPAYTRKQHIDSYLQDDTLNRSTRKVYQDDATYDTVFQTTAGDALILRVHIPVTVSSSAVPRAPQMTLVGIKAMHPWLDSRMRVVKFGPLQSDEEWQQSRMLLASAVHQVVQHFQLYPPTSIEITDAGLRRLQSNLKSSNTSGTRTTTSQPSSAATDASSSSVAPPDYDTLFQSQHQQQQVVDPIMPDIPADFDDVLNNMSREDMQQLLDDELDFLALANTLPACQAIQSVGAQVFEENVQMAKDNLQQEQHLAALHRDVKELQDSLRNKLDTFERLEREQDEICASTVPSEGRIIKQLNKAKRQAMDESEAVAQAWVDRQKSSQQDDDDDDTNVNDFLESFMELRTLHHVRAAKVERLLRQRPVGKHEL